jgi:hypothetical protein
MNWIGVMLVIFVRRAQTPEKQESGVGTMANKRKMEITTSHRTSYASTHVKLLDRETNVLVGD